MKRLFLLTVSLFFCSLIGWAQNFSLSGTVSLNQKPIPDVSVYVKEAQQGTYTDENGFYQLSLPAGDYEVIYSYGNQQTLQIHLYKDLVQNVDLGETSDLLKEVFITAYRVDSDSPITFSNLNNEEINERNLGQDIPILMNYMPSVVTTSDAGAGIGYTGMRVRGSDGSRINTTINGVPLNDGESQGVFWVNLGDFTASVENLQLQRGVGTSTNGAGAFGASLNLLTDKPNEEAAYEITNTLGSFNTHKHQLKFNSGRIGNYFTFSGNLGIAHSDGYRDRAFSDFKSYFLQGTYQKDQTLVKLIGFGGEQQTYQAYYGLTKEELKENRKFNPAGMYVDKDGNIQFYKNQTDNYNQDHFQALWNQKYGLNWSTNLTFHYTYGRGYYESFRQNADLNDFGLPYFEYEGETQTTSNLVNQKWLSNHFYGTVFDVQYKTEKLKATLGGSWNRYWGDHYGEVMYTEFAQNQIPNGHYYDNKADKRDYNLYAKANWSLTDDLSIFGDIQWRYIRYKTFGPYEYEQNFEVEDDFNFINPKAGINYRLSSSDQLYLSYARAHREPNRSDYKSALLGNQTDAEYPKAEQLDDFELGWRHQAPLFDLNANLYYMDYQNQLVLTGEIDPEGRSLRKNSGSSYRLGLELDASIKLSPKFALHPNISLSRNQNKDFVEEINGEPVNFGNTKTSFSPEIVAGNALRYIPVKNLKLILLSKFVGSQYMSNIEAEDSKLSSYFINDFNIQYTWNEAPLFDEIIFTGLVNNIFDKKYESNGYYDPVYGAGYFPQAGINFLTGVTLKF